MMARTHFALPASPMLPVTAGASRDGKQPPLAFDKAADTPALQNWNLSHFVQAVQQLAPDLSWHEALSALDSPSFDVRDAAGVQLLLDTHKLAAPAGESFPVEAFLGRWRNATAQLALLRACITGAGSPPKPLPSVATPRISGFWAARLATVGLDRLG